MRPFIALVLLCAFAGATHAQNFQTLDQGIAYLEARLGASPPVVDVNTLRAILEVISKAELSLSSGQQQQTVPTAAYAASPQGSFTVALVPQTVMVRSGLLGRRCEAVTVYTQSCVWVAAPPPVPCAPTTKYAAVQTKLFENADALKSKLIQPLNPTQLTELIRQVYALAVMAREPFEAGKTRN